MKKLLFFASFFFTYQISFSQDCLELIKALLPHGIYEYDKTDINEEMYHSVISFYKENRQDTYSESKKRSASLTIPIDDVLVGLNLSKDDNGYRQFIQNIELYNSDYLGYKLSVKNSWTHINVEAIDKLQPCFYVFQGISAVKIFTGNPNMIVIRFFYNNDYRDSPKVATIKVQSKSSNIQTSINNVTVRHKNHNEITITKTDDKFGYIDFYSLANTAPNSSLHFDLAGQTRMTTNKVEISKGWLKEASKIDATWGIQDPDPDAAIAQTFRPLNFGRTNHRYQAAWAFTEANVDIQLDKKFYYWEMEMTNLLGGKSGPNGSGGFGFVTPEYKTIINLPTSKNDKNIFYNINLKCGTHTVNCIDVDDRHGIGKKGTVEITGADVDTSFSFIVTKNNENPGILTINNIKSGIYILKLKIPTLVKGSSGLYFPHPDDPAIIGECAFQTNLIATVTINASK